MISGRLVITMNYSAGMVSQGFVFVETKKLAELFAQGCSKAEAWEIVQKENLFQLRNEMRLKKTFNYIYNRLQALPEEMMKLLPVIDAENAKVLVLISIMKTDLLFFEFVYEIFREKIILGEKCIEIRDMNSFFNDKASQSNIVSSWSESGVKKLKQCYIRNLADAGLLETTKTRVIKPALVNYRLEEMLKKYDMETYLNAVKGVR